MASQQLMDSRELFDEFSRILTVPLLADLLEQGKKKGLGPTWAKERNKEESIPLVIYSILGLDITSFFYTYDSFVSSLVLFFVIPDVVNKFNQASLGGKHKRQYDGGV